MQTAPEPVRRASPPAPRASSSLYALRKGSLHAARPIERLPRECTYVGDQRDLDHLRVVPGHACLVARVVQVKADQEAAGVVQGESGLRHQHFGVGATGGHGTPIRQRSAVQFAQPGSAPRGALLEQGEMSMDFGVIGPKAPQECLEPGRQFVLAGTTMTAYLVRPKRARGIDGPPNQVGIGMWVE